ncbi:succinate dehydrogenase/fumarate reductase iron-sulfur subunit [Nitrosophilus kaiyonis]|uniref:succinate dehydrogenase/fumarate reductase iron-sulfur subunit n=1 Tax=Nitrosophilus kaiyonis TaxID=2930200 RepID=UPI002492D376|nr:2Fe-2S iron-sulfur cluster-binding protein [Nitrosophilus kaiyonis]
MKIKIKRYHPHFEPKTKVFTYEVKEEKTLLEILEDIKTDIDKSLTFSKGCRSGVCGSCAVKVNTKEVLACEYKPKENDFIEPLSVVNVIRDLVVDKEKALDTLKKAKSYLEKPIKKEMSEDEEKLIEKESDCILCISCYSSCPVYETNKDFLGPFALMRNYRYLVDIREENKKEKIDAVIQNGIWDCTLCGNCTEVCPQDIDPKTDIMMLQSWAAKFGYTNPNLSSFGSFGLDF